MTLISISRRPAARPAVPFLDLGFRPFFLGAGLFAMATIGLWMAVYVFQRRLPLVGVTPSQWHAHEMIYGYSLAVVAGFLLTAVRNWTQLPTPRGAQLSLLFFSWALPRVLFCFGTRFLPVAAIFDLAFILGLGVATLSPILRVRQWRQSGVAAKLVLLGAGNTAFYLGAFGWLPSGVYWGLYGGLYLIIGLILTMGARVIPVFIQNGVGLETPLPNPRWAGGATLILFLTFFVSEVFLGISRLTAVAAAGLFAVTTVRLVGWHTWKLWRRPLLWTLYASFLFIDVGFLLFALAPLLGLTKLIAIHAMTVGGIGLVTFGMMARVSLGHTGRSIHRPPRTIALAGLALVLATVTRIGISVVDAVHYSRWIGAAQILWIFCFALFVFSYAPILIGADERR